jgi:adenylate kinase family enzyme
MRRVVILGRGAAGKSTLARHLGEITGLPVIELDKLFWRSGLAPIPRAEWTELQEQLVQKDSWILDGDLGPHDAVEVRLRAADTIILLDFALFRCTWRALRRAPERPDFWRWVLAYRRQSVPRLRDAISRYAPNADLHLLRSPEAVKEFIAVVGRQLRIASEQPRPPRAP